MVGPPSGTLVIDRIADRRDFSESAMFGYEEKGKSGLVGKKLGLLAGVLLLVGGFVVLVLATL